MLLASTALPAAALEPTMPAASEVASLPTRAFNCASDLATSVRSPPARITESLMYACTCAGCAVPMLLPTSASTVLYSTFCACQPIVLNASTTPTASPPLVVALSVFASICEVFCASRTMSPVPVVVVVVTLELSIYALACESTRFVAIVAFTASVEPEPYALPPEAFAALSAVALSTASASAVTDTPPPLTVAFLMYAPTSLRTSFLTTSPPSAIAFESLMLLPCGTRSVPSAGFHSPRSP